ncbi:MAG: phosphoribosylamine--glycine ligase [Planctomycetota bacterium]|nr:phosphoribosylamine--glycine ligase [Planctomycetota bacterium]
MNVLIIGSGGREHALAWKIRQSPDAGDIFVAPGNAGTDSECRNVELAVDDFEGLTEFAKKNDIGVTVVGPEVPLCGGISDAFKEEGLRVFGPSKVAAQLEGSKVFCKNTLVHANVPTAEFQVFNSALEAELYVKNRFPEEDFGEAISMVVKADGLAAGKGAIVCDSRTEILDAIDRIARVREFGDAGDQLIIEDRLQGVEASILAITDGRTIVTLPPAQDHKAAYDNDRGPNTGGMGAYSPTPMVDEELMHWVEGNVFVPTIHSMKRSRQLFSGVLYAGLMLTSQGPKVLEYNVRFGDPECQPLLMRMKTDLLQVINATVDADLETLDELEWDPRPSLCVVMASEGYPGSYEKEKVITGISEADELEDVKVFHAGTKLVDGNVETTGGRVLGVTALGDSVSQAKLRAYQAVKKIRWPGAWCRKDISDKALIGQLDGTE